MNWEINKKTSMMIEQFLFISLMMIINVFILQMDPGKRPAFSEIVDCLEIIKEHRLVLPHTNPIAAKSHIAVGHVRRHINKFSSKGVYLTD